MSTHPEHTSNTTNFPDPVFIQRTTEINLLNNILYEVNSGKGRFVVINGEAGTGKSYLVEQFKKYLPGVNAHFAEMSFRESDNFEPYAPFKDLVSKLRDRIGKSSDFKKYSNADNRDLTMETLQNLQSNFSLVQQNIMSAILECAVDKPLVIAVEDVHFASLSAWQFFHYLADKVRDTKIMFIATLRQDGMEKSESRQPVYADIIRRMNRDGFVQKISLARFSRQEMQSLFLTLFKKTDFTGEFISLLWEISGGIPGEIMKYLNQFYNSGILYSKNGIWFNGDISDKDKILHETLDEFDLSSIQKEFAVFTAEAQNLLKFSALLDVSIDYHFLSEVTGIPRINVLREFKKLQEKKYLVDLDAETFSFKRTEIKAALKNMIPDTQQADMHQKIAETLEQSKLFSKQKTVYLLAYHYVRSNQKEAALKYLIQAGDNAIYNFAFMEAKEFYNEAISLLNTYKDSLKREKCVNLYMQSAWLNRVLGNYDDSIENCKNALQFWGEDARDRTSNLVRIQQSFTYFRLNNWKQAKDNLEICLENLDTLQPFEKSMVNYGIGNICFELANFDEAGKYYENAKTFAVSINAKPLIALILNNLGAVANVTGNTMKAIALYSQAIPLYKEQENQTGLAHVYHNIGLTYAEELNWQQANQFYGKSLSVTGVMDLTPLKSITFLNRAMSLIQLGNIAEAEEYSYKAIRLLKLLDDELGIAEYHKIQGIILSKKADWDEASAHFEKSLQIFKQFENKLGYAETLLEIGIMEMNRGSDALPSLQEAFNIFDTMKATKKKNYTQQKIDEFQQKEVAV